MKRYMAFGGQNDLPLGGFDDFQGLFDSVEDAVRHLTREELRRDWWQVVDTTEWRVVLTERSGNEVKG